MMRSLFSGVAGLRTHQGKMDVIGNNIANVNTVAYKSQSVTFQELMYQTTSNASGANQETGRAGVNAKQIGLGVTTGAINTNISTQGASQSTGNPFDIQISGNSFFIVNDGSNNYFTRAGSFYVDGAGNLAMTSNGYNVMGWQEDPDAPGTIKPDTVTPLKIMSPENMVSEPEQTREAYITGIIDKNSTTVSSTSGQVMNISFYDNLGYSYVAKFSLFNYKETGTPPVKEEYEEGVYRLKLSDIVDATTNESVLSPSVTASLDNGTNSAQEIFLMYNTETGEYKGFQYTEPADNAPGTDPAIKADSADYKVTLNVGLDSMPEGVNIAFNTSTMYDNNGTSTVYGTYGDYDGNYGGRKVGSMSGVAVQQDGKIYATYDNGTTKLLGQIAVASFSNPSGLEKVGENLYQTTMNSGQFDGIGKDVTADGAGALKTGVLEMSNVDLSAEFTDMITTQRGFQANSRIITVSDTMLEELTNLKR
ncbi:MAG: flagellar hook-basal body complex protein [Lachnospiraceae bacterium]|nr:flagellar hook-basal body complex protein [Lachnospiraceae bacterium]